VSEGARGTITRKYTQAEVRSLGRSKCAVQRPLREARSYLCFTI
jgi:hypothetical protein